MIRVVLIALECLQLRGQLGIGLPDPHRFPVAGRGCLGLVTLLVVVLGPASTASLGQQVHYNDQLIYLVCIPILLGVVHVIVQCVRREGEAARATRADRRAVGLENPAKIFGPR